MNYVYKAVHPTQPEMFAAVVLASKPTNGANPIVSLHGRYPRPIHGEVLTHKVFGRNARSSRAVPVRTMLNEVRTKPYVPWHWGANQAGMVAGADHNAFIEFGTEIADTGIGEMEVSTYLTREAAWLRGRDYAADLAEAFMNADYHKQNPNRLLEPFSWMDTLITSTKWSNFLHLRDHEHAEPHFQDFARLVKEALVWVRDNDALQTLEPGQWHLPYITPQDGKSVSNYARGKDEAIETLKKISAARCARISYTPFDGDASYERELQRYEGLVSSDRIHASPLEHQATPDTWDKYDERWDSAALAGNLGPGWIQARKLIPGECVDTDAEFWNSTNTP